MKFTPLATVSGIQVGFVIEAETANEADLFERLSEGKIQFAPSFATAKEPHPATLSMTLNVTREIANL